MAYPEQFADELAFLRGGGAMAELIARHDWTSTSLGPLESWPTALKVSISTIVNSSLPMALLLGDEAIAVYNDAYAVLIGLRHPNALGARAHEAWPELAALTDQVVAAARRGERLTFRDLELTTFRTDVPEQAWVNIDCSPVRDETGACLGVLSVTLETTERVLAERRAAARFDRYRNMFEQAPGFICLLGGPPDYVVEYVNEAHKQLFGDRDAEGKPYLTAFDDVAEIGKPEVIFQAGETGERFFGRGQPVMVPMPGGAVEERFIDVMLQPMKDEGGVVTGIYVEGFDVTPLVHAQKAADHYARRLSAAVTLAQLGTFESNADTCEIRLDNRAREIFGFGPLERLTVDDVIGRIDSEDLRRLSLEDQAALVTNQKRREADYRIHLPDGSVRHVSAVGDLIAGPDGAPLWSLGLLEDITQRRRAEQRQRLLINELNHRVKNTLATVQSIASQTLRFATDLLDARASFEARLVALSAAHDLLTTQSWHGARLDEVAAMALAPFESAQRPQFSRAGPPVWLTAPRALALSLGLHELATNAAKYGALAVPQGRISLCWSVCEQHLTMTWIEEGGPPVAAPSRSGFGARLLQRSLAKELGGAVVVEFAPAGVRCEIRFALQDPHGADALQTRAPSPAEAAASLWQPHPASAPICGP